MKYILIILAALIMVNCERDKESLPGSYKLEKPLDETKMESTYYGFNGTLKPSDPSRINFQIMAYTYNNTSDAKSLLEGSLTLRRLKKSNKDFLQVIVSEDGSGEEIQIASALNLSTAQITPLEFSFRGIVFTGAYSCTNEDCSSFKFAMRTNKPSDNLKKNFGIFGFYWNTKIEGDSYKFENYCFFADSKSTNKALDNPQYILTLPKESEEIKCTPNIF